MKIVLDTNVLLISIPKFSKYRPIFDALLSNKFKLSVSNEILSEYREILTQKTTSLLANNVAELLLSLVNVEKTEVYFRWNLINIDADDNKFVDCAIASSADFIVSNDKHFNVLNSVVFPKIQVIKIDEFVDILSTDRKSVV